LNKNNQIHNKNQVILSDLKHPNYESDALLPIFRSLVGQDGILSHKALPKKTRIWLVILSCARSKAACKYSLIILIPRYEILAKVLNFRQGGTEIWSQNW